MSFILFKNDKILAPLKCGTRYLQKCLNESGKSMSVFDIRSNLSIENLNTIIVRPPFEHMISALFTELQKSFKEDGSVDMKQFELILNRFKQTESNNEYYHWNIGIYDKLYWYWRRNHEYVDVVELKNLTDFLISKNINVVSYSENDYNFRHSFYKKDDLLLFVKMNYEDIWNELLEQVKYSLLYYNCLINKTILEVKLI